jgi:hypothetical protein
MPCSHRWQHQASVDRHRLVGTQAVSAWWDETPYHVASRHMHRGETYVCRHCGLTLTLPKEVPPEQS